MVLEITDVYMLETESFTLETLAGEVTTGGGGERETTSRAMSGGGGEHETTSEATTGGSGERKG